MLWAASTITFFGFCRSGEVTVQSESKFDPQTHLCFSDIAVDNALSPNTISIKLKHSKTDQFRKGVNLVMGRTNDNLCPVTALLSYLVHQGDHPGPLFQWDNHTPLSKSKFVDHVRHALLAANVPAHLYTGHSFRIGVATIAASAGIEDSTIQTLGRWKSSAYLLYIRLEPLSSGEFILRHGTVPYLTVINIYLYVPLIIMLCLHIFINLQPNCNSLLVWV